MKLKLKFNFTLQVFHDLRYAFHNLASMSDNSVNMLKAHDLRVTLPRKSVLNVFHCHERAISYHDIKDALPEEFDRVTIYRTLKSFEENGLIHSIADLQGEVSYALCQHDEHDEACKHRKHAHGHFKCTNCDELLCLENQNINDLVVPEGFKIETAHLLIQGICKKCQ